MRRRAAAVAPSVPGARPRPRSMRPGAIASSVPNCSAMTSGAWLGSITPPEPSRMRVGVGGEVGEDHGRGGGGHARHGVVLGDPVAVEAAASARRASSTLVRRASVAVRPAPTVTRSSTERGTGAVPCAVRPDLVGPLCVVLPPRGSSCLVRRVVRACRNRRVAPLYSLAPAAPTRPVPRGLRPEPPSSNAGPLIVGGGWPEGAQPVRARNCATSTPARHGVWSGPRDGTGRGGGGEEPGPPAGTVTPGRSAPL